MFEDVAGQGSATPSALCALTDLGEAVTKVMDAPTWPLSDDDVLTAVCDLEVLQRRLDALRLVWINEAEHRGAAKMTGATSTAAWLVDATLASPGRAWSQVRVAAALEERYPSLREALANGAISAEQVQVCVRALDALPAALSTTARLEAEATLLNQAMQLDARRLAFAGKHLRRVVDPDAEDPLFEAEERARDKNWFSMYSDPDRGGGRVEGWLDGIGQAQLAAALRPLSAPMVGDGSVAAGGLRDERFARQRRGDALVELARRACTYDVLPEEKGQPAQVHVTMTLATLEERLEQAQAFLDDGTAISAAASRS